MPIPELVTTQYYAVRVPGYLDCRFPVEIGENASEDGAPAHTTTVFAIERPSLLGIGFSILTWNYRRTGCHEYQTMTRPNDELRGEYVDTLGRGAGSAPSLYPTTASPYHWTSAEPQGQFNIH